MNRGDLQPARNYYILSLKIAGHVPKSNGTKQRLENGNTVSEVHLLLFYLCLLNVFCTFSLHAHVNIA